MPYSTHAEDFYAQVKASGVGQTETNVQPYITFTGKGTWIVSWTQTSEEVEPGQRPDQRAVCSRSTDDGRTWSPEIVIEAADNAEVLLPPQPDYGLAVTSASDRHRHEGGSPTVEPPTCRARVPAWPMLFTVPSLDRVYAFYWYNTNGNVYRDAGHLYFKYSDDDGLTWSERHPIPLRRTAIDEPGFDMHGWNFGPPLMLPNGKGMLTFTKIRPTTLPRLFQNWHTEVFFLVAENILAETDPANLRFSTYPEGEYGLIVPSQARGQPFAQEATVVPLASGRLLTVMRTDTGYLYYATSDDFGATWSTPDVFCMSPGGAPIGQPVCPAPLTKLRDGRYVLLFHNNAGTANGGAGPYSSLKNRTPLWLAVALEAAFAASNGGLIFGTPRVVIENGVRPKGKAGRTDISYQRFFEWKDRYFIVYNHRKLDINIHEVDPAYLDDGDLPG
jgi:BNR repeat-like domain